MSAAFDQGFDFARKPSRYVLEDFDTLQPGSLTWRVKGLWPAVGVCFVGGPSMSGKSFWTLDAMARVCRGEAVLGRRSKQAAVVYVAAEGAHGVRRRIAGLRQRVGPLGGRLGFVGQQPDLTDSADIDELRSFLAGAKADLEAQGHNLGVVVVDTLAAAAAGADENTSADMGPVLRALQTMALDLGCLVLVVAHTGKDETRGLRGWSGQLGNADGVVMLTEPIGDLRSGTVLKVKDGKSGDRFGFALDVVELGHDEDGDPITTCVIEERDPPAGSRSGRKPTKAEATGKLIMTAFNRLVADTTVRAYAPGAGGVSAVREADLRNLAYSIGVGGGEVEIPQDATPAEANTLRKKWQDQRRKDFGRALQHLCGIGDLRLENGLVWDPETKTEGAR
jgi:hypothetical protein